MLDVQRRLAAQILKCGENRIRFDLERLEDIKEAITKTDIRSLINNGVISRRRLLNKRNRRHKPTSVRLSFLQACTNLQNTRDRAMLISLFQRRRRYLEGSFPQIAQVLLRVFS